ncbi:MAG: hypothetical protein IKQ83_08700 [Lachnospiraceae bacterium]|nr:hypothetical protein [Lachnospiraceae bacterium]
MAYFDSEKNRAMWDKRMSALRDERDKRRESGYKPGTEFKEASKDSAGLKPGVRVITLEELIAKETAKHNAEREAQKQHARSKEMAKEMKPRTLNMSQQ